MDISKKFLKTLRPVESVFYLASLVLAVRLLVRCAQNFQSLDTIAFADGKLWQSLVIVITVHIIFIAAAWIYSRLWPAITVLSFYAAILLSFPFLWILNVFILKIPDGIFLWSVATLWILPAVIQTERFKEWLGMSVSWRSWLTWPNALITLWFIHAVTLFLRFNFIADRRPFGDESTLWYTAAARMITHGFLSAHAIQYDGRGMQPFGVPFIAALPAKLFGSMETATIYFMPVAIIFFLLLFLNSIKHERYMLFFFLVAVFTTFHNRSWMSELCYKLVYGEGLSMIFFLAVSVQLFQLEKDRHLGKAQFLFLSFLIGLLALVKWPLAVLVPVFYAMMAFLYLKIDPRNLEKWTVAAIGFAIAFVPQVLWNLFNQSHDFLTPGLSITTGELLNRLSAPNIPALKLIVGDIYTQYDSFFYYAVLSFIFVFFTFRSWEYLRLMSIMILGILVTFFYAYIFIYSTVEGDWGSALRYYMPAVLALYFFGSIGLSQCVKNIEGKSWSPWVISGLCLGILVLVMVKMF